MTYHTGVPLILQWLKSSGVLLGIASRCHLGPLLYPICIFTFIFFQNITPYHPHIGLNSGCFCNEAQFVLMHVFKQFGSASCFCRANKLIIAVMNQSERNNPDVMLIESMSCIIIKQSQSYFLKTTERHSEFYIICY